MILPALAAVDGVIVNGTTGKSSQYISDADPAHSRAGCRRWALRNPDAQGKFSFDNNDESGPRLIQAVFQGVQYNKMVPPGMPSTGVQIPVYAFQQQSRHGQRDAAFIVAAAGRKRDDGQRGSALHRRSNLTYYDR